MLELVCSTVLCICLGWAFVDAWTKRIQGEPLVIAVTLNVFGLCFFNKAWLMGILAL